MPSRVSALVVNYKSYDDVDGCLRALQRAGSHVEVVVVDHASDAAALEPLRLAHPSVSFIADPRNPGFGSGINRAARATSGDCLLILNPDTLMDGDGIAQLTGWLEAHPATGVVAPLVRAADGSIEASARSDPGWTTVLGGRSTWLSRAWPGNLLSKRNLLTGTGVTRPIDVDWVSGACMLVRRAAFDAVGGFDEGFFLYWEDADVCRRIRAAGWTITYVPGATARHAGARSSRHAPHASIVAFHRSVYRYFLKHGGRGRHVLAPLVFAGLQLRLGLARARSLGRRP